MLNEHLYIHSHPYVWEQGCLKNIDFHLLDKSKKKDAFQCINKSSNNSMIILSYFEIHFSNKKVLKFEPFWKPIFIERITTQCSSAMMLIQF